MLDLNFQDCPLDCNCRLRCCACNKSLNCHRCSRCSNSYSNCSNLIQRDSSSGEKSLIDIDGELLKWNKINSNSTQQQQQQQHTRCSKCPFENASFVMSSHSNSNEDTEI